MIEQREHTNGNGSQLALATPAPPAPAPEPEARPQTPSWLQPLQLTIEQAAIITSYSIRTLKRLVASGEIPGVTRVGRCLRFNRKLVEEWIADGCPRPAGRTFRRKSR
jgi:excisionase family DNA binding protein